MIRKAFVLVLLSAAACGAARTTAATQSGAPFDASKSDPKALAIADQVVAAVGGEANWNKAKEITWTQGIIVDGKLINLRKHVWDRWNGRHQYTRLDMNGGMGVTMHDLIEGTAYAYTVSNEGHRNDAMQSDKAAMVDEANKVFYPDAFLLMLPFKLRDPGTHLAFSEELPEEGTPKGSPMVYDVIKITFDKGVGPSNDTYYLLVDKKTHMPSVIERVAEGKADTERAGFKLDQWTEAGGLKFAASRTTLGYTKADAPKVDLEVPLAWKELLPPIAMKVPKPGELVVVLNVEVRPEPEDRNYVPQVQ